MARTMIRKGGRGRGRGRGRTVDKTTGEEEKIPRGLRDSESPPPPPPTNAENVEEEDGDGGDKPSEDGEGGDKPSEDDVSVALGEEDTDEQEEEDDEGEEEIEAETGVIPPTKFYLKESEYVKTIKIATRCYIAKAVETIEDILDVHEKEWFYSHPQFSHFFHMPRDPNHKAMGMWMLLVRMVHTEKKKEAWFIVNGVPIRYSMREHCLISGLHYHDYPKNHKEIGSLAFTEKHFGKGVKVTQEMVEKKFVSMNKHTKDRLKMAVLYFLCTVIKGSDKQGKDGSAVDPLLKTISSELDACRTFPWGRFTFLDSMKEIDRLMRVFKGGIANPNARFTSFITPLELLAFEAIPCLREEFRDVVVAEKTCPRMCKSTFKPGSMRGFPIEDINTKLGETKVIESIIQPTVEERHLLDHLVEEDDHVCSVVDGWTRRLVKEDQPVFFEQLFKDDIKARSRDPKEGESSKEVKGKGKAKLGGGGLEVVELKKIQEIMVEGFKGMNEQLKSMDERLKRLERGDDSDSVMVEGFKGMNEQLKSMDERLKGLERGDDSDGVNLLAKAAAVENASEAREKELRVEEEAQDEEEPERENEEEPEGEDGACGSGGGGHVVKEGKKKSKKKKGSRKSHGDLVRPPNKKPRTRQRDNESK